jgi:allantoinase
MPARDWALVSEQVVTPDAVRPAAVLVRGEKIDAVVAPDEIPAGCPVEDVGSRLVLPGLVDIHVHINEPGRTDWEGFETATRAAAAGGITTLVDMPLNSSPVTTTVEALRQKIAAAEGKLWIDCGFHGGIVPGNADQIGPLAAAGVMGFKAFLCPSGIDEFPPVTEADLRRAMPRIAATGLPLLVHAELMSPLPPEVEERFAAEPRSYAAYLATRPEKWELDAIRLMIELCREYRCRVHIVHLASGRASGLIGSARDEGLPFTAETCPHYLYFAAEHVPDGDPRFKCAPPIRSWENQVCLRILLMSGLISTVGSDHSPAPPEKKRLETGNLRLAWGGIASLQLSLSVVYNVLTGCAPLLLAEAMSYRPARLVGLQDCKGAIAPGRDADLVVFDPNIYVTVSAETLQHRHAITPYDGCMLRGQVEKTILRGKMVYEGGTFVEQPSGQVLLRGS